MSRMSQVILFMSVVLVTSCTSPVSHVASQSGVLFAEAKVSLKPNTRMAGFITLFGNISVTNTGDTTQWYSNQSLHLILNHEFEARAYTDSVASHAVDFSSIEISPHTTYTSKVYWVFNANNFPKEPSIHLELGPSKTQLNLTFPKT